MQEQKGHNPLSRYNFYQQKNYLVILFRLTNTFLVQIVVVYRLLAISTVKILF